MNLLSHIPISNPQEQKNTAFCNNWSRDQLSVNTKIARFWKSLLVGTVRAYSILVTCKEGDMGVYGIAVLGFFSCGILVILILTCGIAHHLALRYAVFHHFG